jgi:hypothetical protein
MRIRVPMPLSAYSRAALTGLSGLLVLGAGLVAALGTQAASAAPVTQAARTAPVHAAAVAAKGQPGQDTARVLAAYRVRQNQPVTVRAGETLSSISAAYCGTAADWSGLYAANHPPLTSPNRLLAGQVLKMHCYDPGYTPPAPPVRKAAPVKHSTGYQAVTIASSYSYSGGALSASAVGALWLDAGGPAWAESKAVQIAYCESGFNPRAYNRSGATGIWQILGSVVPGNLENPVVNAENAVAKYNAAIKAGQPGFAPWVCQ